MLSGVASTLSSSSSSAGFSFPAPAKVSGASSSGSQASFAQFSISSEEIKARKSAIEHFLGEDEEKLDLCRYDAWYSAQALEELTYSQPKKFPLLRFVFIPDKDEKQQMTLLRMLANKIYLKPKPNIFFIRGEPRKKRSTHFIFGGIINNNLLIINPTGEFANKIFYAEMLSLKKLLHLDKIYFSHTKIQREEDGVSCGPICFELMQHFSNQSPDLLSSLLTSLPAAEQECKKEGDLPYFVVDLAGTNLLPESLSQLISPSSASDYQRKMETIRFSHLQLLQKGRFVDRSERAIITQLVLGDITVVDLDDDKDYRQLEIGMSTASLITTPAPRPLSSGSSSVLESGGEGKMEASKIISTEQLASKIESVPEGKSPIPFTSDRSTDRSTEVPLTTKLAEHGNILAQFNLGLFYTGRNGIPTDYLKSVYWLEKVAKEADVCRTFTSYDAKAIEYAQTVMGIYCEMGWGVTQDQIKALAWYREAASRDNAFAQYRTGMHYYYLGHAHFPSKTQDECTHEGVKWLRLAAEQGYAGAQQVLKELPEKKSDLTRVASQLSPGDEKATPYPISNVTNISYPPSSFLRPTNYYLLNDIPPGAFYIFGTQALKSSCDIYHSVSNLALAKRLGFNLPFIALAWDDTGTKKQAERAAGFAHLMGFGDKVKLWEVKPEPSIPAVGKKPKKMCPQDRSRVARLRAYVANQRYQSEEKYKYPYLLDQKITTLFIAEFFKRHVPADKHKAVALLKDALLSQANEARKLYPSYMPNIDKWIEDEFKKIRQAAKGKPILLFNNRVACGSNADQDIGKDARTNIEKILIERGIFSWYLIADSQAASVKPGNETSLFAGTLSGNSRIDHDLDSQGLYKLRHILLLAKLAELPNLIGIAGNTSGTLDIAAFLGYCTYCFHVFTKTRDNLYLDAQDYRILLQHPFLSIGLPIVENGEGAVDNQGALFKSWLDSRGVNPIFPLLPDRVVGIPNYNGYKYKLHADRIPYSGALTWPVPAMGDIRNLSRLPELKPKPNKDTGLLPYPPARHIEIKIFEEHDQVLRNNLEEKQREYRGATPRPLPQISVPSLSYYAPSNPLLRSSTSSRPSVPPLMPSYTLPISAYGPLFIPATLSIGVIPYPAPPKLPLITLPQFRR